MSLYQKPKRKRWLRWINIVLVVYLLGGVAVYLFQDKMIFHPETVAAEALYTFPQPHKDVTIDLDGNYKMNVVRFTTADSISKGVVLYFHGNMKNISWYANQAGLFTKQGYEVWMPDYPGFGKSTGKLTEAALYKYALQLYTMAKANHPAEKIIIYGRSLGSGIAAWLASKKSCAQLVLETPYYSMTSLAAHYIPIYPASTLVKYKIPTHKYLSIVNAPITIFHGTNDKVIPYSNAEKLKPVLKPTDTFITINNGTHNDLGTKPEFMNRLSKILSN